MFYGFSVTLICLIVGNFEFTTAKVYQKCELYSDLTSVYKISKEEAKILVCIADYESEFNTEDINLYNIDGSNDFGLFHLNNRYWCGDNVGSNSCNISCESLLDDDLTDDLHCVHHVIEETIKWSKVDNGYLAWSSYQNKCGNRDLDQYLAECRSLERD